MNHIPTRRTDLAVAGFTSSIVTTLTLVALSVAAGPAEAVPARDRATQQGVVPSGTVDTDTQPCFMVRAQWNVALDGPQPRC